MRVTLLIWSMLLFKRPLRFKLFFAVAGFAATVGEDLMKVNLRALGASTPSSATALMCCRGQNFFCF